MSERPIDVDRRRLARRVRTWSVEAFHDRLAEAGVTRAYVVSENNELRVSHPALLRPVEAFFRLSQDFAHHEGIFIGREEGIPTLFLAGVHDTRRGLSQGGLRFRPYTDMADVLTDVLRLARGMTRKNALAGLWWGGGKGVVPLSEPLTAPGYRIEGSPERRRLFEAYGRFIASLGGIYYTAEDVGTKTSDLNAILSQNRFTTCIGGELGGSGNPSAHTARGVFVALQAAWRFLTGDDDLRGVGVAVQGVGNVGGPLIELLDDAGARLWVTDIDRPALERLVAERPRIEVVEPDAIFDVEAEIFAPCAIGAQVNQRTIPRLRARLICGAANNILGELADAERLRKRGIAYVPDYLCNRMGITNCADEWQGYLAEDVQLAAERVYPDTLRVLKHARDQLITTSAAADQLSDIAASELHPMLGHRGRRLIDHLVRSGWATGSRQPRPSTVSSAFEPGRDEPAIRVRWEGEGRFRGNGVAVAAAPIAAAGRPDLASLFSALLMDVRSRALERIHGEPPRRLLGTDSGGLALQLAVERSLPIEREDLGRPRFVERCADEHRRNDEAIRDQLLQLGVGFDPNAWLDVTGSEGRRVSRRLLRTLQDAGLLDRERRLTWVDPVAGTVLVSPDVIRTRVEVEERFRIRFLVDGGGTIDTHTFHPELLSGAVAVVVRSGGPFAIHSGNHVADPLRPGERLPIFAVDDLATDAKFLVPAHDRDDHALADRLGLGDGVVALDPRGRCLLPGEPPLGRAEARRRLADRLGEHLERSEGQWQVEAFRSRRSATLVDLGTSEQLFVRLDGAVGLLRRAVEGGAVTFSRARWKRRVLAQLENFEPWCISRQIWWGDPIPEPLGADGEVASVWFSLVATSLRAAGWPGDGEPEPIDEVFVDSELLGRWLVPSLLVSLAITGRPVYRHIHVHDPLHVVEGALEARPGVPSDAPDEERFVARFVRRPMRRRSGNAVEPATLIRRFGADALRLGYLLSLHSDTAATADESHLRRARSTVRRLNGKVSGLFHATREQGTAEPIGPPTVADLWILARAGRGACRAQGLLGETRLAEAAHLLCTLVDDVATWSNLAIARQRQGRRDATSIRPTAAGVVARLAEGFEPICPYLFDKLVPWTRDRAHALDVEIPFWVDELVETLRARSRGPKNRVPVVLSSGDPETRKLLHAGRSDLEALAGVSIELTDSLDQDGSEALGPVQIRG